MVSHGASERLTEVDQNWLQCRLMLILMLMFMTMMLILILMFMTLMLILMLVFMTIVYNDDDADVDVDGVVMVVADVDHYKK